MLVWRDLGSDLELSLRVLFYNLCFKELRTGFCGGACFQADYSEVCRAHLLCAQLCGWKLCAGAGMWAGHSCNGLVKAVGLSLVPVHKSFAGAQGQQFCQPSFGKQADESTPGRQHKHGFTF